MNSNKAREFFSSYFENSLDSGLRQAFERTLRVDAELQAEYRAFELTMSRLGDMKDVEIEVPFDLKEKIGARLDLHLFEHKRARKAPIIAFWKPLVVGGFAMIALVGGLMSLNSNRGGGPIEGGLISTGGTKQTEATKSGFYTLQLSQVGEGERSVTVTNALTGESIAQFRVQGGDNASIELKNSGDQVGFSRVQVQGDPGALYVAVPSKKGSLSAELGQDATLRGAAMRLSARYNLPIVLIAKDPIQALAVAKPTSTDPIAGARSIFGEGYAVDKREDGFIWVQQH